MCGALRGHLEKGALYLYVSSIAYVPRRVWVTLSLWPQNRYFGLAAFLVAISGTFFRLLKNIQMSNCHDIEVSFSNAVTNKVILITLTAM